jgi:transposase-like protein
VPDLLGGDDRVGSRLDSVEARRRLSPSEKYELFVQVLTGQATQREAAANCGVDRFSVVRSAGP